MRACDHRPLCCGALLVFWGLCSLIPSAFAQSPSSTSFVLSQSTVNNGGTNAVSASYVLDSSLSQKATVGPTASSSFLLQSGFWTSLSTLVNVQVQGTGSGNGTVSGTGINCTLTAGSGSGDCSESATHGSSLTLVAVADAANQFDGWAGCDSTSTTTIADDTCQLSLTADRTVTASFTLLGTVSGRVWRDVNGDGVQDVAEPGLDGVNLTLSDGASLSLNATTAGGGFYSIIDVPPGNHSVTVDTASLPAGVIVTFDLDGIATPHTTQITLTDGEDLSGVDFGYQPQVDLRISVSASQTLFPGGADIVYTVTVQNLGPGDASDVTVTSVLPNNPATVSSTDTDDASTALRSSRTISSSTNGCAEDPNGVPLCSLGDIAAGTAVSFTIEARILSIPPGPVTAQFSVTAVEVDITTNDNLTEVTIDTSVDGSSPSAPADIPALGPGGLLGFIALLLAVLAGRVFWRRRVAQNGDVIESAPKPTIHQ